MPYFNVIPAAIVVTLLSISRAFSGDFAEFQSLGFSKDGSVYAFEQFGVQDGSGFPYAERFFIHTESDRFVKGTPIRIRLDNEQASVLDARKLAQEKSAEIIAQLGIGAEPGKLVAFNPFTEKNSNSKQIIYHVNHYFRETKPPYEAYLDIFEPDLPSDHECKNYSLPVTAFSLLLKETTETAAQTLYSDTSIPRSRGCPQNYHLGGVVAYDVFDKPSVQVFLILVESFGFEGPDGRWIAIPKILN